MSASWNSDDFTANLRRVYDNADNVRAVLDQKANITSPGQTSEAEQEALRKIKDEWLECHAREFIIDGFLEALNWQLNSRNSVEGYITSNIVIEHSISADIEKIDSKSSRRLDYLGCARETRKPLLIVEAKRPRVRLPEFQDVGQPDNHELSLTISKEIKRGIESPGDESEVTKEWQEHLNQLRIYIEGVQREFGDCPVRVVLTNGDWVVIFRDPKKTFLDRTDVHRSDIFIFTDRSVVLQYSSVVWKNLNYHKLVPWERIFHPAELPAMIDGTSVRSSLFALRVLYSLMPSRFFRAPLLLVTPLLILVSNENTYIMTGEEDRSAESEVPSSDDPSIKEHISHVSTLANTLREEIVRRLNLSALPVMSLNENLPQGVDKLVYEISDRRKGEEGEYLVVTGSEPHFLKNNESYHACAFHLFSSASNEGVNIHDSAFTFPCVTPKSYHVDGSQFHCTHKVVTITKRTVSGDEEKAFCKIWPFEEFSCCRMCSFEEFCSESSTFQLPCMASGSQSH